MSKLISKKLRGFRDILPDEARKFHQIEKIIKLVSPQFNLNHIILPILESSSLFKRSIGEHTDIVTKEMYSFDDNNGDNICMTPEGTASCVRAVLENNLIYDRGIKKSRFYYYGPMFRHERPQKGRYRQFTQFGVEFFGDKNISEEIDLILLSQSIFEKLGIDNLTLNLNTIGTFDDRKEYTKKLYKYLIDFSKKLTSSQNTTLEKNPLRLLDSKDDNLKDIISNAPSLIDFINTKSKTDFKTILSMLDDLDVHYNVNYKLVRGLDYYNDFVFEWTTNDLGSQDAICAGGRYDKLTKIIGDVDIPAVGFAVGIDRLAELIKKDENKELKIGLSLILDNPEIHINKVLNAVRKIELPFNLVAMDFKKSIAKQIKQADKLDCQLLLIVGTEEMSNNMLTLKYLQKDTEDKKVSYDDLSHILRTVIDE